MGSSDSLDVQHQTENQYVLFQCIGFTALYGLIAYLPELFHFTENLRNQDLSGLNYILLVFSLRFVLSGLLWMLLIPLLVKFLFKGPFAQIFTFIRMGGKDRIIKNISIGLMSALAFFLVVVIFGVLLNIFHFDLHTIISHPYSDSGMGWFIFIFALIPGIWEEFAFRGIILGLLLTKYRKKRTFILNGLFFGFFHIFNLILGKDFSSVLFELLYAVPVGIALASMNETTKSIIPCMIVHYFADVILYVVNENFDFSSDIQVLLFVLFAIIIILPLIINFLPKLMLRREKPAEEPAPGIKLNVM